MLKVAIRMAAFQIRSKNLPGCSTCHCAKTHSSPVNTTISHPSRLPKYHAISIMEGI